MVAELSSLVAMVLAAAAEVLHAGRVERLRYLSFGPTGQPARWTRLSGPLRVLSLGALVWGLATLLLLTPKSHRLDGALRPGDFRHLVLVLDVSPSMRLADAGPDSNRKRAERVADLLKSFFERAPMAMYKVSIIAVYTGAIPVVAETTDFEIVRNILNELPMHYAFKPGPTDLFTGLEQAAKMARHWPPGTTTILILSDGDTIPGTGMPKMPAAVGHTAVIGVGDPNTGKFIDGHLSRQDVSTLRQLAVRLSGSYHNGNEKQIPTDLVKRLTTGPSKNLLLRLKKREYAMMAVAIGSALLTLLPNCLRVLGTRYRPGRRIKTEAATNGRAIVGRSAALSTNQLPL